MDSYTGKSRIKNIKGYKIDTPDILSYVQNTLHPLITEEYKKLAYKTVLQEVCFVNDMNKDSTPESNVFHLAWQKWDETQKQHGQHHTLNDPLRFSIAIGRSSNGLVLATTYHANVQEYNDALNKLPEFTDYSWNFYHDEEEIPHYENLQRYNEWKTLITEEDNFSSLTEYRLGSTHPFITWSQERQDNRRFANQPAPSDRLREKFKSQVIEELLRSGSITIERYISTSSKVSKLMEGISLSEMGTPPAPFVSPKDFYPNNKSLPIINANTVDEIVELFILQES